MKVVFTIASNVFRESVRDKVLYNLVAFAVLLIGASYLIGQLTAGQDIKIIKDLGLAATSVFGLLIAVFIGIGLVSKEVERKSIYSLLSKPVRRREFIAGKYLGLILTLAVNVAAMTASLYFVLALMLWTIPGSEQMAWEAPAIDPRLLKAVALIFAELAIVTAIALFFSSFSTPLLSAALTFGLFVVGRFNADLKNFEQVVDSRAAAGLARVLYYTLPNLAPFDVKGAVVHGQAVPAGYVLLTGAYAVVYIGVVVTVTAVIFSRRDFK
jgi:ABC-type transport system involved in multi-copper enzyme maturation permease subunit